MKNDIHGLYKYRLSNKFELHYERKIKTFEIYLIQTMKTFIHRQPSSNVEFDSRPKKKNMYLFTKWKGK